MALVVVWSSTASIGAHLLGIIAQPFVCNDWSLNAGQGQMVWGKGR